MKKQFIFIALLLGTFFVGCSTSNIMNLSSNSGKKDTGFYVKNNMIMYIKHTKDDKWVPDLLYPGSNAIIIEPWYFTKNKKDRKEIITLYFNGSNISLEGYSYNLKKDGERFNCSLIKGKEVFCKYNTPFCDNGVFGFRVKPYGVVSFNKNKTLEFLKEHNLLQKIKLLDQIISINNNSNHKGKLYSYRVSEIKKFKKEFNNLIEQYKSKKPTITFISNKKITNLKFKSSDIEYTYNFENFDAEKINPWANTFFSVRINKNKSELIKIPFPKTPLISYNCRKDLFKIGNKHFKSDNINQIKNFIQNYYNNKEKKYLSLLERKHIEIMNNLKKYTNYVTVTKVKCTYNNPCYVFSSKAKIKYFFNILPGEKLFLDKKNKIKVTVDYTKFNSFFSLAKKALKEKNYNDLYKYLTISCEKEKNGEACEKLGSLYNQKEIKYVKVNGTIIRFPDKSKALEYFKKGCNLGNSWACTDYGSEIFKGTLNLLKAKPYWEKGCKLGDGLACDKIGLMYMKGASVIKNLKKAKYYFERGCKLGYKESCNRL